MQTHTPRSGTRFYEFEYTTVESRDNIGHTDCKFPVFPPRVDYKPGQYIISGFIWVGILGLGSLLTVGIAVMVLLAVRTDNTGFDPNSSEYALYKNTMFKDCYNTLPNITYNCSAVKAYLREANNSTMGFVGTSVSLPTNLKENITVSWCGIMSCFNDFKVIPSTPRPSVFWPTALEVWNKTAITCFFSFWQLHLLQIAVYSDADSICKGIEWDTWIIMAWDFASFIWWCIGLGRFAAIPTQYPLPSMIGWISVWKYCYMIHHHPFECVLRRYPRAARTARWTLNILATLQWIASVYIYIYMRQSVHRDVMPYPAYDCLASRIVDAPGASACSAEQICSDKALLQSWNIQFPHRYKDGYMAFTGLVAGISITAFVMICARGVFPLIASMTKGKSARRWREIARAIDFGFAGSLGVAGAGCIVVGVITAADAIGAFDHSREGAVALNWDCNALHVNVSPWRYYLDVDYELPLRVARTWFNS